MDMDSIFIFDVSWRWQLLAFICTPAEDENIDGGGPTGKMMYEQCKVHPIERGIWSTFRFLMLLSRQRVSQIRNFLSAGVTLCGYTWRYTTSDEVHLASISLHNDDA